MRSCSAVLLAALLVGCSDYELHGKEDPPGATDTSDDPGTDDTSSVDPGDEECNGKDDDDDGEVDEGYPDLDLDGIKDCMDEDCEVDTVAADTVTIDESCTAPDVTVTNPWDVAIEWQWTGVSSSPSVSNVIMTPVVANLTDDDGDGDIDNDDTPDIVFVAFPSSSFSGGTLVVLDGATGREHWTKTGFAGGGGIALADVDNDGLSDILAFDSSNRPTAVDANGNTLWTTSTAVSTSYPQATVADVNGDGRPEVIADNMILTGKNGNVQASLSVSSGIPYRMPAVGDLDQDGDQEIIIGNTVYDHTGTRLWQTSVSGSYGHWSAIVDYDGDPEAEVVMIGGGRMAVHDHDGTQLVSVSAGASQPGAPCVADFDGDGKAEIGWASQNVFNMYELNGTQLWKKSIDDSSGLASCSGYDVDGDGAYEVFYADQATFHIFDGATGGTNYSQGGHASGTLWEYPAIADVDNDGSAEAVIGSNDYWMSGWSGITVFGHKGSGWMKSGTTWHTHDFAVTNIESDGSVPPTPDPWWQIHNVYRARPSVDDAATDLSVAFAQVCFSGCIDDSNAEATVVVSNTGGTDASEDIAVSLYRNDGGALTLIDVQVIVGGVPSGTSTASVHFTFQLGDVGTDGLLVRVDDDGTGSSVQVECDESNNEAAWTDFPC